MNIDANQWWCTYTRSAVDAGGRLTGRLGAIALVRSRDRATVRVDYAGPASLDWLRSIGDCGGHSVWVWDCDAFGSYVLSSCLAVGLPTVDAVGVDSRGRPLDECWSVLSGSCGILCVRVTLRRSRLMSVNRGGRVGALHTTAYRGLNAFFPGTTECEYAAWCGCTPGCVDELERWDSVYSTVVGEPVLSAGYLHRVYTAAGAAQRLYLRTRYGVDSLRRYQCEHPATRDGDLYLRARKLLLSGMCTFPEKFTRKIVHAGPGGRLRKYDVNGLYSHVSGLGEELDELRPATFDQFVRDRDDGRAYLIVVKGLTMFRKKGLPNVFSSPFMPGVGGDEVYIPQEYAIWRELWDALHEYYVFEEFDVVRVLCAKKRTDSAIKAYNSALERTKIKADERGDMVLRKVCKIFLNSLVGRFARKTAYQEYAPTLSDDGVVRFLPTVVSDDWDSRRFDYVRASRIYTLSRVRVMQDILELGGAYRVADDGFDLGDHHFYTDTDSIVTDLTMPAHMVDPERPGAYKVECEMTDFAVVAKKVYYSRHADGTDEVISAGIPKGSVVDYMRSAYGDSLTAEEFFDVLLHGGRIPVTREQWAVGGKVQREVLVSIGEMCVDNAFFCI